MADLEEPPGPSHATDRIPLVLEAVASATSIASVAVVAGGPRGEREEWVGPGTCSSPGTSTSATSTTSAITAPVGSLSLSTTTTSHPRRRSSATTAHRRGRRRSGGRRQEGARSDARGSGGGGRRGGGRAGALGLLGLARLRVDVGLHGGEELLVGVGLVVVGVEEPLLRVGRLAVGQVLEVALHLLDDARAVLERLDAAGRVDGGLDVGLLDREAAAWEEARLVFVPLGVFGACQVLTKGSGDSIVAASDGADVSR